MLVRMYGRRIVPKKGGNFSSSVLEPSTGYNRSDRTFCSVNGSQLCAETRRPPRWADYSLSAFLSRRLVAGYTRKIVMCPVFFSFRVSFSHPVCCSQSVGTTPPHPDCRWLPLEAPFYATTAGNVHTFTCAPVSPLVVSCSLCRWSWKVSLS